MTVQGTPAQTLLSEINTGLVGWRIPPDVPRRLFGGLVPGLASGLGLRLTARVLHSLIVRAVPATIYTVVAARTDSPLATTEIALGHRTTPFGVVAVDEPRARELARLGGFGLVSAQSTTPWLTELDTVNALVCALAPGCCVVPIAVSGDADAARLGPLLKDSDDTVVAGVSCLTQYGEPFGFAPVGLGDQAPAWIRSNDARMVGLIVGLEADLIPREASQRRNASAASAVAAVVHVAHHRGARRGTIVEYTHSGAQSERGPFQGSVGMIGALFGAGPSSVAAVE